MDSSGLHVRATADNLVEIWQGILNIYINIEYDRKAHLAGDPKREG